MSFKIISTGRALPEYVLTNEKLTTMLDTSDEWIVTRTGIKNRFIITDETLSDLAANAAADALVGSDLNAADIDLIIASTVGGDFITPPLACIIQKRIGASCPSFDINAACTGFIYALDIAKAYFESSAAKNILIVAAEMMSRHVDWTDRASCVLFGDGAGAVLLQKGENLLGITTTTTGNDEILTIGSTGGNSPFLKSEMPDPFLKMNGGEVFKFAVQSMCADIMLVLKNAGITLNDVKKIIPHQANMRIIKFAKEKLEIPDEKIVSCIDRYGNTSSASVPIILDELIKNKELESGDIIVLSAFGGGLTSGACVIKI